jgi:hypothetical protein
MESAKRSIDNTPSENQGHLPTSAPLFPPDTSWREALRRSFRRISLLKRQQHSRRKENAEKRRFLAFKGRVYEFLREYSNKGVPRESGEADEMPPSPPFPIPFEGNPAELSEAEKQQRKKEKLTPVWDEAVRIYKNRGRSGLDEGINDIEEAKMEIERKEGDPPPKTAGLWRRLECIKTLARMRLYPKPAPLLPSHLPHENDGGFQWVGSSLKASDTELIGGREIGMRAQEPPFTRGVAENPFLPSADQNTSEPRKEELQQELLDKLPDEHTEKRRWRLIHAWAICCDDEIDSIGSDINEHMNRELGTEDEDKEYMHDIRYAVLRGGYCYDELGLDSSLRLAIFNLKCKLGGERVREIWRNKSRGKPELPDPSKERIEEWLRALEESSIEV